MFIYFFNLSRHLCETKYCTIIALLSQIPNKTQQRYDTAHTSLQCFLNKSTQCHVIVREHAEPAQFVSSSWSRSKVRLGLCVVNSITVWIENGQLADHKDILTQLRIRAICWQTIADANLIIWPQLNNVIPLSSLYSSVKLKWLDDSSISKMMWIEINTIDFLVTWHLASDWWT